MLITSGDIVSVIEIKAKQFDSFSRRRFLLRVSSQLGQLVTKTLDQIDEI